MPPSTTESRTRAWLRSRTRSFGYALTGVSWLISTQLHAKFHLLATLVVTIAGACFGLTRIEWIAIVLAIGMVWLAEALNTAVEVLVDLVHPEWARPAGVVKDIAAGAVLLAAASAAVVGVLVFWPHLTRTIVGVE